MILSRSAASLLLVALMLPMTAPMMASTLAAPLATPPQTELQYLSGHGPKDAVPWEFSVTAGRKAGQWSTIPVPSQWEQHGFGGYDFGEQKERKNIEHGLYRMKFAVPPAWKGRRIRLVFEGVMTEASVKVNGQSAGATHTGAFYRFGYDITSLLKPGADNLLEVDVAKRASDHLSDEAENHADYWVFGGIFRPVWLEAAPVEAIASTAINAGADGTLTADVRLTHAPAGATVEAQVLDAAGKPFGQPMSTTVDAALTGTLDGATGGAIDDRPQPLKLSGSFVQPRLWTAETPNLYKLRLTLKQGGKVLHTSTERFGFRTFEVRKGDGLYLNGKRIIIKGVNRHSFRPDTGRSLTREDNYEDARLIKSMNMNLARMSHYPPDPAFLEAADELGLYVIDELSGWQHAHGTDIGRCLIKEMLPRDVNHPSILFWANGNEGGWNRELDNDYALYDPQKRPVLHPWELHSEIDTKHYPNYELLSKRLAGPNIFMPTEFLHALYDGGGGAGLNDYWTAMMASRYGAGGVIWALVDEGIQRTDQNGRIDVFGTYGPDGLVGPHHEKEGSYYAVRHLWSPVQLTAPVMDAAFTGKLKVDNLYDFRTLEQHRFNWRLLRYSAPDDAKRLPQVLAQGTVGGGAITARSSGEVDLALPANWRGKQADALEVTVLDQDKQALWTWAYATPRLAERLAGDAAKSSALAAKAKDAPRVERATVQSPGQDGGERAEIRLIAGAASASFDAATGQLRALARDGKAASLSNGPRLSFARPAAGIAINWLPLADEEAGVRRLTAPQLANTVEIDLAFEKANAYARFKLEITPDGRTWKTLFDGTRRAIDGKGYDFPPQPVLAVRMSAAGDNLGNTVALKTLRLGYAAERFPVAASSNNAAVISSGAGKDATTGEAVAWLEARNTAGLDVARWSMRADGTLKLDYAYKLDGTYQYHGITFDHAESEMQSLRWLGEGPFHVWQNRLQGSWLGVHETRRNDIQPGESWGYPEFQGFYAGVRWARLATTAGALTITPLAGDGYLRVGTPRVSHSQTTVEFPGGDLSYLHAIPAIGSKFINSDLLGPSGQWARASGEYRGSLTFKFTP